jgi:hypothetical protein
MGGGTKKVDGALVQIDHFRVLLLLEGVSRARLTKTG